MFLLLVVEELHGQGMAETPVCFAHGHMEGRMIEVLSSIIGVESSNRWWLQCLGSHRQPSKSHTVTEMEGRLEEGPANDVDFRERHPGQIAALRGVGVVGCQQAANAGMWLHGLFMNWEAPNRQDHGCCRFPPTIMPPLTSGGNTLGGISQIAQYSVGSRKFPDRPSFYPKPSVQEFPTTRHTYCCMASLAEEPR